MARIVISHLAPADTVEIAFLCDLARAFETQGHAPVIWSAIYDRRLAPWYLPHNWRLKRLPEFFGNLPHETDYYGLDAAKWRARVDVLAKQEWEGPDRAPLLAHLVDVSRRVVDALQPDLFLAWNTMCPHTGIAAELCAARGARTGLIERAVFPHTWFLEQGGLIGHSTLAGVAAHALITDASRGRFREIGESYLRETSFGQYNRYAQTQESEAMRKLLAPPHDALRPRVAFFPPDDLSLGFLPAGGTDRKKSLPGFESSFAAAQALARAHGGITIFKPHPSFLEQSFDVSGTPNLHVVDYDFRKLMDWADIVASSGSGLEFIALAQGKPLVLMANDLLLGKGVAYEALDAEALPVAVRAAQEHALTPEQISRFHEFIGCLLCEHLVSASDARPGFLKPDQIARRISEEWLEGAGKTAPPPLEAAREALLTPHWQKKLKADTAACAAQLYTPSVRRGKAELLREIAGAQGATLVLDFDNTLLLENSTELFLKTAWPQPLAFLLSAMSDAFVESCARQGLCRADRWRDFCRTAAVTLGMPWHYLLWRWRAADICVRHGNAELIDAVRAAQASQVLAVSFGMRRLIAPLLRVMLPEARLLACDWRVPPLNLRKTGKLDALLPLLDNRARADAVFVSDSEEDSELFSAFPKSFLVQWAPYAEKAFEKTYFPLRYAVQGKYTRRRYFWNQIIKEDLLLILLSYPFGALSAAALSFLLLSFYAVYEIGLWENDHRAASAESKPTLAKEHTKFAQYPIHRRAPVWALALALPGIALLNLGEGGLDPGRAAVDLAAWAGILALIYAVFRLFNALPVQRRAALFPALHLGKTFSFAALITPTLLGVPLLAAQVCAQTTNYLLYRRGADTSRINRQTARLAFFLAFCAGAALWSPGLLYSVSPLHIGLVLAWSLVRIAERRWNTGFLRLLRRATRRLV